MNILVIGDVMIDINHHCTTYRKAPEADIPVYNVTNTDYKLGGASNVSSQLNNLACNVELVSVIGDDIIGEKIKDILTSEKIKNMLFIDNNRATTQKIRLLCDDKIVNRHDIETTTDIEITIEEKILSYIYSKTEIHAIAISDYQKGVITKVLCETLIDYCNKNGILTFIDPKTKEYTKYKNCFCFKPNLLEGQLISGYTNIYHIFEFIKDNLFCKNMVLTCGENGMYLNNTINWVESLKDINVVDVTGSGDIVFAMLIYYYLLDRDMLKACRVANYIAGKGIQYIGNYKVSLLDIEEYNTLHINFLINNFETDKIEQLSRCPNIVFTNGCFDVIHSAHISLLRYAKTLGNKLIVGLNSDSSVKSIKGEKRPINNQDERIELLKNLGYVDHIILFNDDTPYSILSHLKPNVLVKGGDYTPDSIIGKEFVNKIIIFDYIKNKSSTLTINKIYSQNKI
jgi:D-beta-D-heptose 7-phosphate kinase/D-beta-D-heptose 1-phosphate adenosyltransferase